MPSSGAERLSRIVLDTSAYSRMRLGNNEVLERLSGADSIFIPAVVLGELEAGFRSGTREAENRVALEEFINEPFVSVLDVTADTARRYGALFSRLKREGKPLPANDIWIAASAIDAGAPLLTCDTDFKRIAGLELLFVQSK